MTGRKRAGGGGGGRARERELSLGIRIMENKKKRRGGRGGGGGRSDRLSGCDCGLLNAWNVWKNVGMTMTCKIGVLLLCRLCIKYAQGYR